MWCKLRMTAQVAGPFDLRIYTLEGEEVFARQGTLVPGTQEVPLALWATSRPGCTSVAS